MAMSDVPDAKPAVDDRSKWIGIYVGILAMLLAICTMGGGNATKDATRANIEASNTWAFFQAKNTRRTTLTIAADDLELSLAATRDAARGAHGDRGQDQVLSRYDRGADQRQAEK